MEDFNFYMYHDTKTGNLLFTSDDKDPKEYRMIITSKNMPLSEFRDLAKVAVVAYNLGLDSSEMGGKIHIDQDVGMVVLFDVPELPFHKVFNRLSNLDQDKIHSYIAAKS